MRDVLSRPPGADAAPRVASDDRAVLAQLQAALVLPSGAALGWPPIPMPSPPARRAPT